MSAYSPPIDQLLHHGWDDGELPITSRFHLTVEHIPALVQLATDRDLWLDWHEPESIGTSLALMALAELGAIDHVPAILDFICELDRDYLAGDWVTEEMGDFLASFGPKVAPILTAELPRRDRTIWMLSETARALRLVAEQTPSLRNEAIEAISNELARRDDSDPELNGLLLVHLMDLKATEAAPVIEQAFSEGLVDKFACGDWPEVRYQLGLGPKPPTRRRNVLWSPPAPEYPPDKMANPKVRAEQRKSKRKAAKRARKRNRARG